MAYKLYTEGSGPFPILHIEPLTPPEERSGSRGPFYHHAELVQNVVAAALARCYAGGCPAPAGRMRNTWAGAFNIPRRDADTLITGFTVLLSDLDPEPLRRYLIAPPRLVPAGPLAAAVPANY